MLTFTYKLRNFGKASARSQRNEGADKAGKQDDGWDDHSSREISRPGSITGSSESFLVQFIFCNIA
jgi:hypothetical protein